jgi:hypothetical protein
MKGKKPHKRSGRSGTKANPQGRRRLTATGEEMPPKRERRKKKAG